MKALLEIFSSFFKVGIATFGGGYAMMPILEREAVENKHWVTMEEVMDYYAISQCTPGIIAINTATYVGYKVKKIPGAIAAAVGVFTPSVIIIIIIAELIQRFSNLPMVTYAFGGIQICVAVIITNAVIKMLKSCLLDWITTALFIGTVVILLFFDVSTILVILTAIVIGILLGRSKA